jgi:hypothetical protein
MHVAFSMMTLLLALAGGQLGLEAAEPSVVVKRGHVATYPRAITGRIVDNAGKPIAGALIEWGPRYPDDAPQESTRSGQDGTYRLEVQKAGGNYSIGISAAGFCPQWNGTVIPGPTSAPTQLDWKMAPETSLEVAIVSQTGDPIPNLEVTPQTPQTGFYSSFSTVQQPEPIPGHRTPTTCDERGICQLHQLLPAPVVPPPKASGNTVEEIRQRDNLNQQGWLHLRVTQNGKWIHEQQITAKEYLASAGKFQVVVPNYRNPLVTKQYTGTLHGQVFGADGQPVTEYHVTLRHRGEPLLVKDPAGRFEWGKTLDPDRQYEVRVFAPGFAPQMARFAPSSSSRERPHQFELTLHPSAEFQLLDGQTQKPIPGVAVVTGISSKNRNYVEWHKLKDFADGSHGLDMVLHLVTDDQGRIHVPEADEPKALIILAPGFARQVITPELRPAPDAAGTIPISLAPAAAILGVTAPGTRIGKGETGVMLHYFSKDGYDHMYHDLRRDENGDCRIDSLAAGDYLVMLQHSLGNSSTTCWSRKVSLRAGEQLKLNLGEMTGSLTFSGRIDPFTDIRITQQPHLPGLEEVPEDPKAERINVATISDIDGYFEFNQVEPGAYKIEIGSLKHHWEGFLSSAKGPSEILLYEDTHADFTTGTVTPPEAAVPVP